MAFSREKQAIDGLKKNIERNKIMAKVGSNPDFKLAHPDWVRDAQNNNYKVLETRTKEEHVKRQKVVNDRRNKLGRKN